jgi:hypothetical protein
MKHSLANPERRVRHDPLCTRGDTGYSNWDFVYAFVLILIGCGLTAWCLL